MSVVGERSQMYVGGAWVGAASGKTMRVTNPATGEALAELPDSGRDDALAAGSTSRNDAARATTMTAISLGRICEERRLTSVVIKVLTRKNTGVIGQIFLDHPAKRKIAFTGSTEVGKRLMAGASKQLRR